MKRYIKAWGTKESFGSNKKNRSTRSNPDNWQKKQKEVIEFLNQVTSAYPGFSGPISSPSSVQVQSDLDRKEYFKFDLWEDDESIEEQQDNFIMWADRYAFKKSWQE